MQILNLSNVEKSNIKYTISHFPDGEVQITLGEFSHKDPVEVACRITNAEELFILMQVADILNRHDVVWHLHIYYLMGARMDRVMDFNRPYTLKIVANLIKNLGCRSIYVLEPHSDMTPFILQSENLYPEEERYDDFHPTNWNVYRDYLVVFPDKGAYERYDGEWRKGQVDIAIAEKVRNVETGVIESIKILNPEVFEGNTKPIMVVDDLCDGGGTFVGIANEIRKYTDKELNIFVTHMVNPVGIRHLANNFDHVYFTNSYKDWKQIWEPNPFVSFPENVTQFNVI